jgi:hypothetical protein
VPRTVTFWREHSHWHRSYSNKAMLHYIANTYQFIIKSKI